MFHTLSLSQATDKLRLTRLLSLLKNLRSVRECKQYCSVVEFISQNCCLKKNIQLQMRW